ncbi:glycosyltransferase family 32 protein [Massilia sp.]|uniref:glycosyltransferase family 32 protein n=1 Tax=Massilia sp. TaxID=1882437 RepID=UPI00352E6C58
MNLFSILIADQPPDAPPRLPPAVARNIGSFKEHHPGLPHRLYDQPAIRAFLRAHMEADVCRAYEELLPYAYRADLARLCLLHEFGGAYADLSVFFHEGLPLESGKLVVFRDRAVDAPWIVSNTIIAAPARLPAFEAAIRMIVAHCRRRYRGVSSLCPTGPVLFGKAIALHCEPEQIHLGEVINVAQRETTETLAFVDATNGRLVAYRAKSAAGLDVLGMDAGVNNYNDFYNAHLVYASDFPVIIKADFLAAHGAPGGRLEGTHWLLARDGGDGALAAAGRCRLPFPFAAGRHRVLLDLAWATPGEVGLAATAHGSGTTLACTRRRIDETGPASVTLDLDVEASRKDIVVAILAAPGARVAVAGLRIERLQGDIPT